MKLQFDLLYQLTCFAIHFTTSLGGWVDGWMGGWVGAGLIKIKTGAGAGAELGNSIIFFNISIVQKCC